MLDSTTTQIGVGPVCRRAGFILLGMHFHMEPCSESGLRGRQREEGTSQVILKRIQELRGFMLRADSVHMILYRINKI